MAGNPQAAQSIGLLVFPFTFVSSAFVPVESMPGWMQAFAQNQPLTQIVNATRALSLGDKAEAVLGHPAGYFAIRSLLWCAALHRGLRPPRRPEVPEGLTVGSGRHVPLRHLPSTFLDACWGKPVGPHAGVVHAPGGTVAARVPGHPGAARDVRRHPHARSWRPR